MQIACRKMIRNGWKKIVAIFPDNAPIFVSSKIRRVKLRYKSFDLLPYTVRVEGLEHTNTGKGI